MNIKNNKGIATSYILVFGSILLVMLAGLLSFVLFQLKATSKQVAWKQSFQTAEAGANYYQWCLNNEVQSSCSKQRALSDLSGNKVGTSSLDIDVTSYCGSTTARTIRSTGYTVDFPEVKRELQLLYGKKSVAKFAYLLNDSVWAGSDREIRGTYHSNGGIRMDGENQSVVKSAQETWMCTENFNCDPDACPDACSSTGDACECPGVFTTTDNSQPDLFSYPVSQFDFDSITMDLANIKDVADDNPQKFYWPEASEIDSSGEGYHIKFLEDGRFEVRIVTDVEYNYAYNEEDGWHYDQVEIGSEYEYDTISIDAGCPVIFVEDKLWLDGKVKGKTTIAAANLAEVNEESSIILPGDIDYTTLDGSDGLTAIAEEDVLISPDSPEQMELRGIFIAQKGRFGRNLYPDNTREKLEIYGSIVSNDRVGTQWVSSGQIVSGYLKRENYVDTNLLYQPPPFTPFVSEQFEIVNWKEVE
ncbi:MAG: hypothetical protein V5A57_02125 [Candidatus Paceibacterota bacterium]